MRATLPFGTNRCMCTGCGRYFGGVSGFDAHQTLGDDGRPVCHDPATLTNSKGESLGYELSEAGYWTRPMPEGIEFTPRTGQNRTETASHDVSDGGGEAMSFTATATGQWVLL